MKSVMNKLIRDEKGAALIVALILLLVAGLIAAPLLAHMGTGLITGEIYETRTAELYAADAGVEDAIWKIQHGETPVCAANRSWTYPSPLIVNGRSVEVTIRYQEDGTFKITSTAVTVDDGGTAAIVSATTVESYVSALYMDFSSLLEHAIVSNGAGEIDVEVSGKTEVVGSIWLPDDDPDNLKMGPNVQYDPDKIKDSDDVPITWPTYEQLSSYYMELVEGAPDPGSFVDIKDLQPKTIGPCDREGNLAIDNTGDPATLVLEDTVYVRGDLEFWQAGSHDYTINLNGETIFVEGSIRASSQISVSGSGCIIAKGDIDFQPGIASQDGEFVLVMSIQGDVTMSPLGDFTGCIAANGKVDLQPNGDIEWISPEDKGLDFPGVEGGDEPPPVNLMNIESWEIIQQ